MKTAGAVACARAAQQAIEAVVIWADQSTQEERVAVERSLRSTRHHIAVWLWCLACKKVRLLDNEDIPE